MNPDILDFIVNKVLFWLLAGLLALETYNLLLHGAVPNLRTAPAVRRRLIELLRQDCAARGLTSYTIVDLGSGNGLLTREIARALPAATVIGLEIARPSLAWSNFMRRRQGLTNLSYRRQNVLTYDFAGADAVVMYLIPELLGTLGERLHATARPGTLILNNTFKLGDGWQPVDVLHIKPARIPQGKLFVYRATTDQDRKLVPKVESKIVST